MCFHLGIRCLPLGFAARAGNGDTLWDHPDFTAVCKFCSFGDGAKGQPSVARLPGVSQVDGSCPG